MSDPIEAAIAKAAAPPPPVNVSVRLSSKRVVGLVVPPDLSGQEALDLVGFISVQLADELERRRPQRRILVPVARG